MGFSFARQIFQIIGSGFTILSFIRLNFFFFPIHPFTNQLSDSTLSKASSKNEFEGSVFDCYNQPDNLSDGLYTCNCLIPDLNRDCLVEGEEILIEYEYQDVDKWNWLGVLVAMACFYYFLFYVFLRVFNTGER